MVLRSTVGLFKPTSIADVKLANLAAEEKARALPICSRPSSGHEPAFSWAILAAIMANEVLL